ncbi:MAG: DUF1071 domain-containing protein [Gammaproteobacteria bacterium]|nr:MAG: DUF1071 domain-containing protein [Gammaproteobacteria bacterium]
MSFAGDVWKTLSSVNVNDHVEKKGNLSYLSWAWAWGVLMDHYPDSQYSFREPVMRDDSTCEVWVDLTIADGEKAVTRSMWLPAMDNRNNAVKNPDARKISDTRMRCLTKAISMFGLGHYIYAGEDLPQSDLEEVQRGYTKEQKSQFDELLNASDGLGMWILRKEVGDEVYAALNGSFDQGKKMECKQKIRDLEKAACEILDQYALDFASCIDDDDLAGVEEFSDVPKLVKAHMYNALTPEQKHKLSEMKKTAA